MLWALSAVAIVKWKRDELEFVGASLPFTSNFYSHLDTFEHVFGAALIIDSKLENIPILKIDCLSLCCYLSSRLGLP